jgi:predicted adenylyl cyclase CyaB
MRKARAIFASSSSPTLGGTVARNVEIKARIENVPGIRQLAERIADSGPSELVQDDTFFRCARGRLKLRVTAQDEGELILYRRDNRPGPKESTYLRSPISQPDDLRELLVAAFGQSGRVRKQRTVYLVGRTRIHLDIVEKLGHFVELEVVLQDGESVEDGALEANRVMKMLGIDKAQLVEDAYVDLIARAA